MPQMMPLNWLMLMMFFSLIFYIIFTNLYFNFTPQQLSSNSMSSSSHSLTWKW
uniref:ATP synthase F0 subunit 8 n=1 Tax=Cheumatopsyche brevilineata TaxID=1437087 RepID=UPI002236F446|nr:ATP synthase F0 subunit 8 [Cheumatopsyche brevilineata]UYO79204.1 ATP synthase F0 subunit 8 [Cheumatopsyche brevilineata]